ncbi:uncharacterized protein [Primulina huaijiensis]|uniref:uncharacterized protein isoform X1 n=2 Tax=Primulina huaijiensis TaxID=1492673 RepID=UPI003CC748E7
MAGQEGENKKMALDMSMQQSESPEPKRSKPMDTTDAGGVMVASGEEFLETDNRLLQGELGASAEEEEKPTLVANIDAKNVGTGESEVDRKGKSVKLEESEVKSGGPGMMLSMADANKIFLMTFGNRVAKDVLSQWTNQGIRFSAEPKTSVGLVQYEGGPCGVLAAIQAFVLKYLLFDPEESGDVPNMFEDSAKRRVSNSESVAADIFYHISEEEKSRALVRSMNEILFLCGSNERAVIASLGILDGDFVESMDVPQDEVIAKVLEGLSVESGYDLHKVLRVNTATSRESAFQYMEAMLPMFRSRMGTLLFLISALLSRGLDNVLGDRDDPSQPLVTSPFGHASQEIVNLLLSGRAVANVFNGNIDLGGGMFVKGISTAVEVGFLTLLESFDFCKVGQYLKCPRWPIWVIGSESHYTVLFALDSKVQEENELENRETQIRRAFDAQDQSGGGGFINVEGFRCVIKETGINFPPEKVNHLCSTGFIVWSEFRQALLDLDKTLGGIKYSGGSFGEKVFDLYHFNGIAKSSGNDIEESLGSEIPIQRPRLTKLRVSVPPRWTQEEFWAVVPVASDSTTAASSGVDVSAETSKAQHAPLVDCIRTRWQRAICYWDGDAPSIV